jgi:FkbM family methyltransferase
MLVSNSVQRLAGTTMRHVIRSLIAAVTRRIPTFRGEGRLVLALDRALTDISNPQSYLTTASVNRRGRLLLDLRLWDQRFAFYYGTWENDLTSAVDGVYRSGAFYDIGASVGLYTVRFARRAAELGAVVRAIEPIPANVIRIRQQLDLNDLEKLVSVYATALSDQDGMMPMELTAVGIPGNARMQPGGTCNVSVTTLDSLWKQSNQEPIGHIKVDTEGFDVRVVMGGKSAIATCRPSLLLELNRRCMQQYGISIEPCWNFLIRELNYRAYRVNATGLIRCREPESFENLLFLPSEHAAAV